VRCAAAHGEFIVGRLSSDINMKPLTLGYVFDYDPDRIV